jgi:RNA polymerase sigma-70 factor (ECF subfamily)
MPQSLPDRPWLSETTREQTGGTGRQQEEPQAKTLDGQDFQTFYQEHIGPIYRYIYSRVSNRQEAEDLTAQTFLKAAQSLNADQNVYSRKRWLFQVARTTVADYWRTYYRISVSSLEALLEAGWEGPTNDELAPEPGDVLLMERVQRILQALPSHYREVLTCRFLLNFSLKETALRMGITEANVKVLQYRALKRAADVEAKT